MVSSKYVHKFLIRYTQSGTLYSFLSHTHNRSIKYISYKTRFVKFLSARFFLLSIFKFNQQKIKKYVSMTI